MGHHCYIYDAPASWVAGRGSGARFHRCSWVDMVRAYRGMRRGGMSPEGARGVLCGVLWGGRL